LARNPITIEVLETLDAINRRGTFAKAAEELNKATSTVSYSVQKLEEQLDIALFQRQGRRSVLTDAGRLILVEGRGIIATTARLANKAKEVATGWEPRLSIGIESLQCYPAFFDLLNDFLLEYPTIEIDICECVLNGGWEALDQGRVDLLIGSPGPVPLQRGYRVVPMAKPTLIPVISAKHKAASHVSDYELLKTTLPQLRRVITHDTSSVDVARSEGLSSDGRKFYVQNIDQKVEAILAGIGIGHLPQHRIQAYLDSGALLPLNIEEKPHAESFLAWKISHKGKALQALTQHLLTMN
jgi:DNA-binding transcriptional LysR family regulator